MIVWPAHSVSITCGAPTSTLDDQGSPPREAPRPRATRHCIPRRPGRGTSCSRLTDPSRTPRVALGTSGPSILRPQPEKKVGEGCLEWIPAVRQGPPERIRDGRGKWPGSSEIRATVKSGRPCSFRSKPRRSSPVVLRSASLSAEPRFHRALPRRSRRACLGIGSRRGGARRGPRSSMRRLGSLTGSTPCHLVYNRSWVLGTGAVLRAPGGSRILLGGKRRKRDDGLRPRNSTNGWRPQRGVATTQRRVLGLKQM